MRFRILALVLVSIALQTMGCKSSTMDTAVQSAVVASNTTASIVDALQTSALVLYRFEQELALSTAVQKGEGKTEAMARVQVVRDTWRPIWDQFSKVRTIHETLATLISTAGTTQESIASATGKLDEQVLALRGLLAVARARVEGK